MPKVSICLTSYNHDQFLKESIESILNQTFRDYELFVVDDCSSDDSWEIIERYSKVDTRIKAIRHDYNWGNCGLEILLKKMQGEYVAIAHCDDRWEEDKLSKQVRILDEQTDVSACFTLVNVIDDEGNELENKRHPYYNIFDQPNRTRYEWLNYFFYRGNCLCHPSLLIRKDAYTKYNMIPKGLHGYPDFLRWIRLCEYSNIYIIQEKLTDFRIHGDGSNTSGDNPNSIKRLAVEEYFVLQEFLNLIDQKQLLYVFPELEKYVVNGEIEESFALAKLMMSIPKRSYYIRGLGILYELFQNDKKGKKIERLYGYTSKDYNVDKQKVDIFSVLPDNRFMTSSVYWDEGNGYNEIDRYVIRVFLQSDGSFSIKIPAEKLKNLRGKTLRFDPDEGHYRKFKSMRIHSKHGNTKFKLINGISKGDDDFFYTLDPQYEIDYVVGDDLFITGYTEILSAAEIEHFSAMKKEKYELLEQQYLITKNQLEAMKNSKVWRGYTCIKKFLKSAR